MAAPRNFFITWVDPTNPAMGLDFFPPKGSDELFEALREYYPHCKNLQSRMQAAVIDFYLEHQTVDAEMVASHETPEYLASPHSTFASSMSTPLTQSIPFQPTSPTSVSPASVPKQEDLMNVWTLPSNPDAKIHKRRNMTAEEKLAYKQKRLQGACADCKRRRRKCVHSSDSSASSVSGSSTRKKIKRSKQAVSAIGQQTQPIISEFQTSFDTTLPVGHMLDSTQFNLELGEMLPFEDSPAQDLAWSNDFLDTFDFSKDFQLFTDTSNNFNNFVPTTFSPSESFSTNSKQSPVLSDFEQYLDMSGMNDHTYDSSRSLFISQKSDDQQEAELSERYRRKQQKHRIAGDRDVQGHHIPEHTLLPYLATDVGLLGTALDISPHALGDTGGDHGNQRLQSQGHRDSSANLFAAAPVEPTVSRSRVERSRHSASRPTKDLNCHRHEDWSETIGPKTSETLDHMQRQRETDQTSKRQSSRSASAFLTIPTASSSPREPDKIGDSTSRNVRPTRAQCSSVNTYTTLTFSIPTATLTSRLCSVLPSLSMSPSSTLQSQCSSSSSSATSSVMVQVPMSISVDPIQLPTTSANSLLSLLLLFVIGLFSLFDTSKSKQSGKDRSFGNQVSHVLSTALSLFTLSSPSISSRSRKSLKSTALRSNLNLLLSPLGASSSTFT